MSYTNDPSAYVNYGAYSINDPNNSKRRPSTQNHHQISSQLEDFNLYASWPNTHTSTSASMYSQHYFGQNSRDPSPFSDSSASVSSSSSSWSHFPSSVNPMKVFSSGLYSSEFPENSRSTCTNQPIRSNPSPYPPPFLNSNSNEFTPFRGPGPFLAPSSISASRSLGPNATSLHNVSTFGSFQTPSKPFPSNSERTSQKHETRSALRVSRATASGATKQKPKSEGEQKRHSHHLVNQQRLAPPSPSVLDQGPAGSIQCTLGERGQEVWHCPCGKTFTRYWDCKRHSEGSTSCPLAKERLKQQPDNGAASRFTCQSCRKSFSRHDSLARHRKNPSACNAPSTLSPVYGHFVR